MESQAPQQQPRDLELMQLLEVQHAEAQKACEHHALELERNQRICRSAVAALDQLQNPMEVPDGAAKVAAAPNPSAVAALQSTPG